jgi:hypothetical protein
MTSRAAVPSTLAAQKAANDSLFNVKFGPTPEPTSDTLRIAVTTPAPMIGTEARNDKHYDREGFAETLAKRFLSELLHASRERSAEDTIGHKDVKIFLQRNGRFLAEASFWKNLVKGMRATIGFSPAPGGADYAMTSLEPEQLRFISIACWNALFIGRTEVANFGRLLLAKERFEEANRKQGDQELLNAFETTKTLIGFLAVLSTIVDRNLPARIVALP